MARKDFGMVSTNRLEVLESPLTLLPGVSPIFSVNIAGSGTLTTPTMKLYKGSKDVSATNLSGSMDIPTGSRTITCKQIIDLTPGDWVFYVYFQNDGIPSQRFCRFYVNKEGA